MIALTFNVIIPPADLSGVFTLHGIHYEKQSRSPGLALPGELGGPAAASSLAVLACVECCRRIPAACVGTARRALRAMFRKTRLKLNVQVAWCAVRLFLRATRALCQDAAFIEEVEFENVQEQEPALQTSAGLASPKPITREPSPPPLPPPADPPPDSSPTLRQCLECRAVSQKKNNASHCVEILEDGFPHSDLVKCGIW